jgi:hypothetical protein
LTRAVDFPHLLEVGASVALGVLAVTEIDCLGGNAERPQEAAELLLRQWPAVLPVGPRPLGVGDELGDEVGRSNDLVLAEGRPDVPQELDVDGAVLLLT